jgi:hypothetical protein
MKTIVNRLKHYLDFKNIAISAAETEIGISNASLSKPFKNGTTIKTDTLEKFLITYNDINSEWLLTGKEPMLKSDVVLGISEVDHKYKELADARLDVIDGLKFKIATLEKQLSELNYTQKETFLYKNVAEPAPELTGKKNK